MPKTGGVSLLPSAAWRRVWHCAFTPKSQEEPKTCLDEVPSEFPGRKHHWPAQKPQSAQGYHVSCSTGIDVAPEESKPFTWFQVNPLLGWRKIQMWATFYELWCWARCQASSPILASSYRTEKLLSTATSLARPSCCASKSSWTSQWHFIIHGVVPLRKLTRTRFTAKNTWIPHKGK